MVLYLRSLILGDTSLIAGNFGFIAAHTDVSLVNLESLTPFG